MEVILLERVANLGDIGSQVNVKSGFGRNFLIPYGKAVAATKANIAEFESRRAELEAKAAEKLKAAQARADKIDGTTLDIEVQASEEGKLFGSIGTVEISDAINKNDGADILKSEVLLPEGAIHSIGEYEIHIQLHSDVTAAITLNITAA